MVLKPLAWKSAQIELQGASFLEVQLLQTDTNLATLEIYRLVIQSPGKGYQGPKKVIASATEASKSTSHCGYFMRSGS